MCALQTSSISIKLAKYLFEKKVDYMSFYAKLEEMQLNIVLEFIDRMGASKKNGS